MSAPVVSAELERELRSIAVRYAGAADRRDAATFAELFTEDGAVLVRFAARPQPVEIRGRTAVSGIATSLRRYERTFHVLGQSSYTVEDGANSAAGETYCVAHHVLDGEDRVMYIRYLDTYRRTEAGWQIVQREANVDFQSVLPVLG
ncbi:MAG TPA: nuclear transport factor 2 family protein [Jatrophihabitans sp.]|jgi:ketosteroid isomerase-like protein